MEDLIRYDFADIHIYGSYMIVIMNEGVHITPEHNQVLINITDTYYKNKKFVYITHRINSYSVDPKVYIETSKIENLAGFCVVSKNHKALANAEIEKLFLNKPVEVFTTLDDAKLWAKQILDIEFS